MVVRNWVIRGTTPWMDIVTALALAAALVALSRKPAWLKPLSWIVLGILFMDVLDGVFPNARPITTTHVFFPLLVLYGAFLCDLRLTAAALLGVLGLCAVTWLRFAPMQTEDMLMLFNIVLATLISAGISLSVWLHHLRLMKDLEEQAQALRQELEINDRLHAVISHDIFNPLTALMGHLDMAEHRGKMEMTDIALMQNLVTQIDTIVKTARIIKTQSPESGSQEKAPIKTLAKSLGETFAARLKDKNLQMVLEEGEQLEIATHSGIFLNSVLGNMLSNAIKFSPKGGTVRLRATSEPRGIRMEIQDDGCGFPPGFFEPGDKRSSTPGTEGERGTGRGLAIAALYASKLGGTLEVRNHEGGGASASVVLPRV